MQSASTVYVGQCRVRRVHAAKGTGECSVRGQGHGWIDHPPPDDTTLADDADTAVHGRLRHPSMTSPSYTVWRLFLARTAWLCVGAWDSFLLDTAAAKTIMSVDRRWLSTAIAAVRAKHGGPPCFVYVLVGFVRAHARVCINVGRGGGIGPHVVWPWCAD